MSRWDAEGMEGAPMADPTHRFIETNGIRMHIAEQGYAPGYVRCRGRCRRETVSHGAGY